MSNNLPRVPVRFLEHNQEMIKAQEGLAGQQEGATDYSEDNAYAEISGVQPSYRVPVERANGNPIFRRYVNGSLDIRYAADKVIDALHRVRNSGGVDQLNTEEKTALSVLFPMQFDFVPSGMTQAVAAVHLRLSPLEVDQIRHYVSSHLAEEMNWNAGRGGGSTPGRSQTEA